MENFDFLMDHESLAGPYLLETAEGTRLMGIAGSLVEIEASVPTRNLAQVFSFQIQFKYIKIYLRRDL